MKYSLLLLATVICFSASSAVSQEFAVSEEFEESFMQECTKLSSFTHCKDGLQALIVGIQIKNFNVYFETMGFIVPSFRGGRHYSLFWTTFDGPSIWDIAAGMSEADDSLWNSFNILPGYLINTLWDDFEPYDTDRVFWPQFSTWMALHSNITALWLTGGTHNGYFPYTVPPKIWETYELPYLDKGQPLGLLIVYRLPATFANRSQCSEDIVSFNHLRTVNPRLKYVCCDLLPFDRYNTADPREVGFIVAPIVKNMTQEIESECSGE